MLETLTIKRFPLISAEKWGPRKKTVHFNTLLDGGLVAQWITRLTTDQKIPGSNPGELAHFL